MVDRGIYLGTGPGGFCFTGPESATLVLGPSRSGKTSSLVIPNILSASGAVVATSTKPDVMRLTSSFRGQIGHTYVFDPSGTMTTPQGVVQIGWSPINAARTFDGALAVAHGMVRAARRDVTTQGGENHWIERASALLAPLLHAAAQKNAGVDTLLHWVDRHDGAEALSILAEKNVSIPADVLAGIVTTDQREQSSIWSTASGVLSAYRAEHVLQSTKGPFLDAEAFVRSSSTLYISAPSAAQEMFAPLVVGLLQEVKDATYRAHGEDDLSHAVLFALDEVANMAPLPDLPQLVSEGAGQGLITMACLQDLSQGRKRWGRQADSFFSLFGMSVILPGIADISTLETLSKLAGTADMVAKSVNRSGGKRGARNGVSYAITQRPRLPSDVIARGYEGHALVLDARKNTSWVALTPVFAHPYWKQFTDPHRAIAMSRSDVGRSR